MELVNIAHTTIQKMSGRRHTSLLLITAIISLLITALLSLLYTQSWKEVSFLLAIGAHEGKIYSIGSNTKYRKHNSVVLRAPRYGGLKNSNVPQMDDYQWHEQRKQPNPFERGAYLSAGYPRYLTLQPREEHMTSDRSEHSSYALSQAPKSRCFELSLSTDNSLPFHPSPPNAHFLLGHDSFQIFPYNRGISPDYCHLQEWNFWNLYYGGQPHPEAWYPGLCSVGSHRNSKEGFEMAQGAARQEFWQSVTHRTGYKSRTRWPARFNSQLQIPPKNTDGISHRSLATYRRHYDGVRSQYTNKVISDTQVKIVEGSQLISEPDLTDILHAFIEKLSIFPVKENSVQTIENCITASHLPVKTSFVVDKTVLQNHKRPVFSGTLYINDVFIANVSCYGKKLLKHKVYDAALHVLKNTSAQHLLAQSNLQRSLHQLPQQKATLVIDKIYEEEADKEMLLDNPWLTKISKTKQISKSRLTMTNCEQEECLNILIQDLKLSTCDGASIVLTIDKKCIQLNMKLLTVYKILHSPGQQTLITCDLYILDCHIAQGQGSTRKKAQSDAYFKGGDILKQSKGYEVLFTFPKFNEEELNKPDIFDIVYKGYAKVYESNRCRLNRLKQLPVQKRKISDLVIIEHEDWAADRKKHSHCILNQSATQCGCLLEWTIEPENDCFRCTMRLQGEAISSVLTRHRKTALRMASCVALFRLYETQPVIQGFHLDHPQVWISREKLIQHLESSPWEVEEPSNYQADGNQEVDKRMTRAIEEILDQFFSCPTVEEFVPAPDWKLEERKLLRTMAISKGLRVLTDVYCDDRVPIISQKYDLSEMVRILEERENKSQGRYRLLPTEERPSYNDIAGEVAANESMIKRPQTSARVGHHYQLSTKVVEDEEENTPDNDLSWLSEDDHLFQTANSTFSYSAMKDLLVIEKSPTLMNSNVALPKRTSTPVKHVSPLIVDECECNFGESSRRNYVTCLSPTIVDCFYEECSQLNSKSPEAVLQESLSVISNTDCNLKPLSKTSSLSTSVVQIQQIKIARNFTKMMEDSGHYRIEGLLSLPEANSHQKFNKSVDLEAGMIESHQVHTDHRKKVDQLFTKKQQQWMEHEY